MINVNTNFPRPNPAVIMLVTYKDSCLLVDKNFKRYALLWGFVEHGETGEQAVKEELMKKQVKITMLNIDVKSSLSLLLGFHAEALGKS